MNNLHGAKWFFKFLATFYTIAIIVLIVVEIILYSKQGLNLFLYIITLIISDILVVSLCVCLNKMCNVIEDNSLKINKLDAKAKKAKQTSQTGNEKTDYKIGDTVKILEGKFLANHDRWIRPGTEGTISKIEENLFWIEIKIEKDIITDSFKPNEIKKIQ